MPTYNGDKITTGTLYEDGTIEVKDGFPRISTSSNSLSCPAMQNMTKKNKILPFNSASEDMSLSGGAIANLSKKQAIKTPTVSETPDINIGIGSMNYMQKKTSIVTP